MIAMPVRITMAIAPFAFGALWAWWGNYDAVLILCLVMAVFSLVAFMLNLALAKEP
jgi:1,4-dihydroxy-2-naphthoate octaprenyltransferase